MRYASREEAIKANVPQGAIILDKHPNLAVYIADDWMVGVQIVSLRSPGCEGCSELWMANQVFRYDVSRIATHSKLIRTLQNVTASWRKSWSNHSIGEYIHQCANQIDSAITLHIPIDADDWIKYKKEHPEFFDFESGG